MKKSKAIIILLCALLVLLGVGYVDLYGVDAEGTASASDISLGLDQAGGVSITYQVVGDEEPDATDMADTIAKLQKRVENYSKEVKVDKTMLDYYTKLSDFHAQFRYIGTNYNQVVKELRIHFSEKKAMALLYKLEKCTIDLVKLSREIVELSREMEKCYQSKSD